MRILVHSPYFFPRLGGLENIVAMLSRDFVNLGHEVVVVTNTPLSNTAEPFSFPVIRNSSLRPLMHHLRWCDIFLQFNLSLRALPALALMPRPWVVSHQSWLSHLPTSHTLPGELKRLACRFATNICCSQAIADNVQGNAIVIPNPYDNQIFFPHEKPSQTGDVLVVARLVSDKGVALALQAVHHLLKEGRTTQLTIVGDGPEKGALEAEALALGIHHLVLFTGPLQPREVAEQMRQHRILVVPSIWEEPFGIVALEGLACGCEVIVSDCGGLPEALGSHGKTFSKGNALELAFHIKESLKIDSMVNHSGRKEHLQHHESLTSAKRFIAVLESCAKPGLGIS
ncbi:hypothetical protein BH11VER1_BH11VER1_10730 [soil metagenome]